MPQLLAWLTSMFRPSSPMEAPDRQPRLLNPGQATSRDHESTDPALHSLESHLFCWLLDCKPSELEHESEHSAEVLPEIARRIERGELEELPRQPMTLPKVMQALSDENRERHELARVILQDAALTDQLLQVANSPFFRHGEKSVESVDQAIFLLGVDGIRSVVSAAVMRPMLAARNSGEAMFAQRVWRWGLACARSAELIARAHGQDANAFFLTGLMPSLAYLTLRREVDRVFRARYPGLRPDPAVLRDTLHAYDWATCQLLTTRWELPPVYNAYLLAAERPAPTPTHTPLNDGMILGTREVLRHARQRNLAEDKLRQVIRLEPSQFDKVREAVAAMLRDGDSQH